MTGIRALPNARIEALMEVVTQVLAHLPDLTDPDTPLPPGYGCALRGPHTHSIDEAAAMAGMAARTLTDKAHAREVDSTRTGKETRFTDEQINAIIRAARQGPAPARRDSRRRS